jgi:hypothetical protein
MRFYRFSEFIKESETNFSVEKQEKFLDEICSKSKSKWSKDDKGLINIEGDFIASYLDLKNLMGIKFGQVNGEFDISNNDLESLEGCPRKVIGDFSCSANYLNSLQGGPEKVEGKYLCANNKLFNLEGIASDIKSLNANGNFLEYLSNLPQKMEGFLVFANNNFLGSLKGCPEIVEGKFDCSFCGLTSLEGGPKLVKGNYDCSENGLKNLKGAPEEVGILFLANNNELVTLEGFPESVGLSIKLNDNNLVILNGLENFKFRDNNRFSMLQNGLPNEILQDQVDYVKKTGSLDGWLLNYLKKDNKLAASLNLVQSERNTEKVSRLGLEELSFENPGIVYDFLKDLPESHLLRTYVKDNMSKFSPSFQKLGGMGLSLKNLGF